MLWYILGFTGFAMLLAIVAQLVTKKVGMGTVITTVIIALLANGAIVYFGMPWFTHLLAGGWTTLVFMNLIIAGVVNFFITMLVSQFSENSRESEADFSGAIVLGSITLALGFLLVIVALFFIPPRSPVDNPAWDKMAALLPVEEAVTEREETGKAELLLVAPSTAKLEATAELKGDIGTYLGVGNVHLVKVGGKWYYITDLDVTNGAGFRNRGSVIPGFMVRDAEDPTATTTFRSGYTMSCVPDAWFNENLNRRIYQKLLGTGFRATAPRLEMDDDWRPFYISALTRHVVGVDGMKVFGVMLFDPQSCNGEILELNELPEWVDRVYPIDLVTTYAGWWATYAKWDDTFILAKSLAGKKQVDMVNDVVGPSGDLEYQITFTSVGADQSLTEIVYVNPTTLKSVRYAVEGRIASKVDDLIDEASTAIKAGGYEPVECELQRLLGVDWWYCILVGRGAQDGGGPSPNGDDGAGSGYGFSLVQTRYTEKQNKVLISTDIDRLFRQARQQIATDSSGLDSLQTESAERYQIAGTISRLSAPTGEGGEEILFTLSSAKGAGIVFRVDSSLPSASLMRIGDTVIVTGVSVFYDDITDVTSIEVQGLPKFLNEPQQ